MKKSLMLIFILIIVYNLVGMNHSLLFNEDFNVELRMSIDTGPEMGFNTNPANVWENNPGWERWNGPRDGVITKFNFMSRTDHYAGNDQWTAIFDAWGLRRPFANQNSHLNERAACVILRNSTQKRWLISPIIHIPSDKRAIHLSFDVAMTNNVSQNSANPHSSVTFEVLITKATNIDNSSQFQLLRRWDSSGLPNTSDINSISNNPSSDDRVVIDLDLDDYEGPIRLAFFAGIDTDVSTPIWFFVDNVSVMSDDVSTFDDIAVIPLSSMLYDMHPNPLHSNTHAKFNVFIKEGETATLSIFNIRGQLVKEYNNIAAGNNSIQWDRRDNLGREVGSGIYFYRLSSPSFTSIKRMVILN